MSYSPFAVIGTANMIKANKDRLNKSKPIEEDKEEKQIDYTELFRKTYFPHLASPK